MPPEDKIAKAIAATEAPQEIDAMQVQIRLAPNGRPAMIAVPKDITDMEWLSLTRAMLDVGDQLRKQRPTSRLVLPQGVGIS